MPRSSITLARFGDWSALYLDGVKILEGHSLHDQFVIETLINQGLLDADVENWEVPKEFFDGELGVPDRLSDYGSKS